MYTSTTKGYWYILKTSTHCYRLLPVRDQQKNGNYWAILRVRPGKKSPVVPEYMPNATYSYQDVARDFQLSGFPLLYSRYWTETPLSLYKVTQLYQFFGYLPRNKISLTKFNEALNLHNVPTRLS
jgi:hypothetical protein